ncbi:MAG: SNARE-binding exocyst subunit S6 [Vezdaea acicularis]|nr:MAG: SNARE-binding exocyst subunit S6 [Vezdaea acicularis]
MSDAQAITVKLAELLRQPEDLDKIPALKSEFLRKKSVVDGQLKLGLKEQLEVTQDGITSITDGQRTVNLIKEEMMKIDKLCAEAQIRDFPNINLVSQTHRNFGNVERMKADLEAFNDQLTRVDRLIEEDEYDIRHPQGQVRMPNLIPAHYELTKLRNIRDDAIDQIRKAEDTSLQSTLEDYFSRLDVTIDRFDSNIDYICENIIGFVANDGGGLVVRMAVVIEDEEKNDLRAQQLQDAQRDYKELAARFKSITTGHRELRNYKQRLLDHIRKHAEVQLEETKYAFEGDTSQLSKALRWFYQELFTVQQGLVKLMPKKWRIFKTYVGIYHNLMHDTLLHYVNSDDAGADQRLAIINYVPIYYQKMDKLQVPIDWLDPHVLDNREEEVERDWRDEIIGKCDSYTATIMRSDKSKFLSRNIEGLRTDDADLPRTPGNFDLWKLFHSQLDIAASASRDSILEGVVSNIFRILRLRQETWLSLVDSEVSKMTNNPNQGSTEWLEDRHSLEFWLVAIANDQINAIDDDPSTGHVGFLSAFQAALTPLCNPNFLGHASQQLEAIRIAYIDVATRCTEALAALALLDVQPAVVKLFTPAWYNEQLMSTILLTCTDVVREYNEGLLHAILYDIFAENLHEAVLVQYLSAVRNKNAKFKRSDRFLDQFRSDLEEVLAFLDGFTDAARLKDDWRVVDRLTRVLSCEKLKVPDEVEGFKRVAPDLQAGWVEAVIRARDDWDRGMLRSAKAKMVGVGVRGDVKSVMSKVK